MQTTNHASALVKLIKSESERLMEYFDSLSPEDLEKASPCEKWTVGEVIAHLVWHVETYRDMMERGLRGDLSPTEGLPSVPTGTPNRQVIVDESYGQAAIDRRRSLGRDLILSFTEQYGKLNTLLAGITPEDWDKAPLMSPSSTPRQRAARRPIHVADSSVKTPLPLLM